VAVRRCSFGGKQRRVKPPRQAQDMQGDKLTWFEVAASGREGLVCEWFRAGSWLGLSRLRIAKDGDWPGLAAIGRERGGLGVGGGWARLGFHGRTVWGRTESAARTSGGDVAIIGAAPRRGGRLLPPVAAVRY